MIESNGEIHIGYFEEGSPQNDAGEIVLNMPLIDGGFCGFKLTLVQQRKLAFLLNTHIQDFEMTRTTEVMLHSYGEEASK